MSHPANNLSADKQTLLALRQLRLRVEELERASSEPIAIVGMACRFPGGISSPEDFWKLLIEKRDAITEIPRWRVDLDRIFTPFPAQPGRTYSRWAGLLDHPDAFDAEFFGIAPREAGSMDPQQRWLLEVSWEALENAGINPKSLAGANAGVFLGISASEYGQRAQSSLPAEQLSAYTLQGSALNAAAGRLAYFYGFSGPAMAIDSACSSSLVAVDRACRSLRDGESALALAAGVNLIASAEGFIIASQWGMLSERGVCAAFDESADGFVRGEGCGVLVLKRLRDAEAAGDHVRAVILGSAVNQDGASSGLTVPNGLAQQALLHEAHRRAGIEPRQVGYVEAHGTGTRLGDPIEAEALGKVFAGREGKLAIGSVKANLGHLESAAGVAGLMRVVLSLEHGEIPGQLHWSRPSPHVLWGELPLNVVTENRAWEPVEGRRIGGVSSFGFSGTNAHVVLEGWTSDEASETENAREDVLVISARTEPALRELAGRYAEFLETEERWNWAEICHTAGAGRAEMSERLAVVAGSRSEAAAKLRSWLRGEAGTNVRTGHVGAGQRRAVGLDAEATPQQSAEAWMQGAKVNWEQRRGGRRLRRVPLPQYAFQHERYWIEERRAETAGEPARGALLGRRLRVAGVRGQYEARLESGGWIGQHEVNGERVLPATGHIELMLEAGAETLGSPSVLEELVLETRLDIHGERRVQVSVEQETAGRSRVRIYAERGEGDWERVSEGWLRSANKVDRESTSLETLRSHLRESATSETFYAEIAERGVRFGERFRGVQRVWTGDGEALGEIALTTNPEGSGWQLSPWWLDACLQVVAAAAGREGTYLPVRADRVELYRQPGDRSWSHVRTRWQDDRTVIAEVDVLGPDGSLLARLAGLRFRKIDPVAPRTEICRLAWRPFEPNGAMRLSGHWLVLCEQEESAARLASDIRADGGLCSILAESSLRKKDRSPGELQEFAKQLQESLRAQTLLQGIVDLRPVENARTHKQVPDPEEPLRASARTLLVLQSLLRENIRPETGVWLLTWGAAGPEAGSPPGAAIWALARTALLEFPELAVRCLDLGDSEPAGDLFRTLGDTSVREIVLRDGRFFQPERMRLPDSTPGSENSRLEAPSSGLIDDLRHVPAERREPGVDEVEIRVEAHGLNFRDVLTALAMMPGAGSVLGGECAGTVVRAGIRSGFHAGDRAFAFAPHSFQAFVTVPVRNVAHIPGDLTSEQAAALPIAYLTALYGLDRLASLREGETILIHAAAGGLGLAALHLAHARGAEVFATAGSEEKCAYLRGLGVRHVFSSRTGEFAEGVLEATAGRGVDVVLNSLTGELAEKNLTAIAPGGRLLEVGKRDTLGVQEVQQRRSDVAYFVYDLGEEAERDSALIPTLLAELLRLMKDGSLAPLPVTPFSDVHEAFRYMAQARQIGKVVVRRSFEEHAAVPISPQATYLITGGCGGLGMIFAESLVERGARSLLVMGRSAPSIPTMAWIEKLRSQGAQVTFFQSDVADRSAVGAALAAIPQERPLKGILHLAGVLDDRSLLSQDQESLRTVMRPKWLGAWNLHESTEHTPLDFFILFSSAAVSLGSPGQANYAAANATLDALAVRRRNQGLPGLSVQWGPWTGGGMAEHLKVDPERSGLGRLSPAEGIHALDRLLASGESLAEVLPVSSWHRLQQWQTKGDSWPAVQAATATVPTLTPGGIVDHLIELAPSSRYEFLSEHLRQQVIHILSLPEATRIDEDEALHDLGLDSLMAVELRNALVASLGQPWSPTLTLDYPTLRSLAEYLLSEMFGLEHAGEIHAKQPEDLSEAEAEELLLQELGGGKHDADR
ncbi:MAG TPA: SDR family NAD(P)-dependent oxidoreductase [Acidobacteriaceae bacterium]|jgi:acyl transferase domain-containing protein/acyl carrier protein|nr:SDR family NAD(P)-dependent oxidoreductase [Acidobacteriaceae bacterium]